MNQTNHFFDLGYGWLCKHCSAADTEATRQPPPTPGNFFRHAAAEHQHVKPSLPLASWTDASRQVLTCPRCGIEEQVRN